MNLSELFDDQSMVLDVEPCEKEKLLETIIRAFDSRGMITDFDRALSDVIEREKVMSTGIGNGVAIPHAYTDGVNELVNAELEIEGVAGDRRVGREAAEGGSQGLAERVQIFQRVGAEMGRVVDGSPGTS